jgi:hypothetical protein
MSEQEHRQAASDRAHLQADHLQAARDHAFMARMRLPRSRVKNALASIALVGIGLGAGLTIANNHAGAPQTCPVTSVSAVTIQAAMKSCANGGTVTIPAGTFALTNHMVASYPNETITGAGQALTKLVQHSRVNLFQITAPGVTIEDMSLDVGTYNPGNPPIPKNPVPGTIFSNALHTSVLNLTSFAGTGFGMRFTKGPTCDAFPDSGTVLTNVTTTNAGSGGFTSLDIDCTNGATLTNITVHGDYIALYEDENVVLNGEVAREYLAYQKPCVAPWYVSGPSNHLLLENVDGAGAGVSKASSRGPVTFLSIVNNTKLPGCK